MPDKAITAPMAERGNRTGLLIVVGVVVIGLGAIAAWLFWWNPRQARAEAQAQVTDWEKRWLVARTCILGDPPLAGDAGDALALSELASGSLASNAADCTAAVSSMTRPEGAALADEVEAAFAEVQAAIPAVAKAYAFRISSAPDEIDRRVAELGVAINALDAAHDRLRAVAGLAAIDRGGGAVLHRTADPIPLVIEGEPLLAPGLSSVHGGVLRGARFHRASQTYAVAGPAPDQVRSVRAAVDAVPALPDASWMAAVLPARAFDEKAAEGTLVPVALPAGLTIDHAAAVPVAPTAWIPIGALGKDLERSVVLVPDMMGGPAIPPGTPALVLAASKDGGKAWAPVVREGLVAGMVDEAVLDLVTGRLDVVIRSIDEREPDQYLRLDAARPTEIPAPVSAPELRLGGACRRGDVLWWLASSGVYRLAGAEPSQILPPAGGTRVHDCTADAVLIEEDSMPVRYHRCAKETCAEVFRGSTYAYGRAGMLDDGTVVYAAGRGAVIALWTEGVADPTYFKLPRPFTLHSLVVWDGVPNALVHAPDDDEQALYAVPLKKP